MTSKAKEISLGDDFGPVIIKANRASVQIDPDGTIHSQKVSEAPKKPKAHSSAFVYRGLNSFTQGLNSAWNWAAGNPRLEKRGIPFSKKGKQTIAGITFTLAGIAAIPALMGL